MELKNKRKAELIKMLNREKRDLKKYIKDIANEDITISDVNFIYIEFNEIEKYCDTLISELEHRGLSNSDMGSIGVYNELCGVLRVKMRKVENRLYDEMLGA